VLDGASSPQAAVATTEAMSKKDWIGRSAARRRRPDEVRKG
jgi:hypothetical protein